MDTAHPRTHQLNHATTPPLSHQQQSRKPDEAHTHANTCGGMKRAGERGGGRGTQANPLQGGTQRGREAQMEVGT